MFRVAAIALLLPLVASYDLAVGLNSYGSKIFEEDRQANPAIWRQKENVTIVAPDNEVISKVLVIDMRPEKDGDAKIVDGGEKQKNVTIELKSPTVLRGYHFHIEVYAVPVDHSEETETTDTSSEKTDLLITDSISTVKCSTESVVANEENTYRISTDTTREGRNLVIKNNYESNDTEINTSKETTALSELTTLSDTFSTVSPYAQSTISNLTDFPEFEMKEDETRHVRKIGDDLYTSTVDSLPETFNMATTVPNSNNDNVGYNMLNNETDVNNTKLDETYDTTTISGISTTMQSEETFTMSPNGKDILDFDDLLSTAGEENRFVRHVNSESDTTTSGEISTTESGDITTAALDNFENETRNSREAINETTEDTETPQSNDEGDRLPPILQTIIAGKENYNSIPYIIRTDEEDNESSGDFTTDVNDTTVAPEAATTIISDGLITEEQLRKGRGIVEENHPLESDTTDKSFPNYPGFIDPAILSKSDLSNDYVYVPILAVISKHNYPAFRSVLDNISMNVALPNENANMGMEQQISYEMSDNKPIVS